MSINMYNSMSLWSDLRIRLCVDRPMLSSFDRPSWSTTTPSSFHDSPLSNVLKTCKCSKCKIVFIKSYGNDTSFLWGLL